MIYTCVAMVCISHMEQINMHNFCVRYLLPGPSTVSFNWGVFIFNMFLDLAEIRAILLAKEFETLILTGKYSSYPILKRNMQNKYGL